MSSRRLEEIQEEEHDLLISKQLGITLDEFYQLNHDGIQDESNDDGVVYNYYIQFSEDSPQDILKKIEGLDETNTFYFSISDFG